MSVEIVQFEPWHLQWLLLQPEQAYMQAYFTASYGPWLKNAGPSYSAIDNETLTIVGCAGIMTFWPGRAMTWALMSKDVASHVMAIHRVVVKGLKNCPATRLELLVDPLFPKAVAWAIRLGFHFESRMPYYSPSGTTQDMYVKITRKAG